jgi:hypothetical protein
LKNDPHHAENGVEQILSRLEEGEKKFLLPVR